MSAYRNPDPERMAIEAEERALRAEARYDKWMGYWHKMWHTWRVGVVVFTLIAFYGAGMGLSCSVCESHGASTNNTCEMSSVIWPLALPAHAMYSGFGNFDTEIAKAKGAEEEAWKKLSECNISLKKAQRLLGESVVNETAEAGK